MAVTMDHFFSPEAILAGKFFLQNLIFYYPYERYKLGASRITAENSAHCYSLIIMAIKNQYYTGNLSSQMLNVLVKLFSFIYFPFLSIKPSTTLFFNS